MRIRNLKSGKEYDATQEEWDTIIRTNNAYKYEIVNGEMPELKALRAKLPEKKIELKK